MRLLYVILAMLLVVLPVYAGTFRDDFENEKDFLNDKQLREGGVWGEDIAQFTWENGAIIGQTTQAVVCFALITGNYGWKDYTVECKVKITTDLDSIDRPPDCIGLYLRRSCIDCNSGYAFLFGKLGVDITRKSVDLLKVAPFQISKDVWYTLKAVAQGERLEFYADNKLVLEAEDNVCPAGKAGFFVQNGGGGNGGTFR